MNMNLRDLLSSRVCAVEVIYTSVVCPMWVTLCAVFAFRGWQGEGKIKVAILPDLTLLPSDLSDCTQRRTYSRAWLPGPWRHRFLRTQESEIILNQYFWSLLRNLVTQLPPWSNKQLLPVPDAIWMKNKPLGLNFNFASSLIPGRLSFDAL